MIGLTNRLTPLQLFSPLHCPNQKGFRQLDGTASIGNIGNNSIRNEPCDISPSHAA
jgi:hypothetical protein